MLDSLTFTGVSEQQMAKIADSLPNSLYNPATTIFLDGELGAGKTTFVRQLSQKLGCPEPATSPTYALEQRYPLGDGKEFIHIDLYRLTEQQAAELLRSSEDFEGIRCIEWGDRLSADARTSISAIDIHIHQQEHDVRDMQISFRDISFPTREQIVAWRQDVALPEHIQKHCDAVADLLDRYTAELRGSGAVVRPLALRRAGELHDLLRFTDFTEESLRGAEWLTAPMQTTWAKWINRYQDMRHEEACAAFLQEKGFLDVAHIVEKHGFLAKDRVTTEQKLLYYADKRVKFDTLVSVRERFDDLILRYANGKETEEQKQWYAETVAIEKELFGDQVP